MPIYFKGNPLTLIAHEQEVPWPDYTQCMDYELELGFVIGRAGKDLAPEQAKSYLFGVTILNDFSARDIQVHEMQGMLLASKGKDFATALGPWITTTDELDVHRIMMVARVNGEEWSRGSDYHDHVAGRGDKDLCLKGRRGAARRIDRFRHSRLGMRLGAWQAAETRRCGGT